MDKYITHRQDLCAEQQALLSTNSTREIELTDTDLEAIYGGAGLPGWLGLSDPTVSLNPAVSFNPAASANPAVSFNPTVSSNPQGFSSPGVFASFSATHSSH